MPLNLKVSYAEALRAFGSRDIKQLLQSVSSGHDTTTGLPVSRPNVTIVPAPTEKSDTRTITWNLAMIVAESDEDNYEEFSQIVEQIVDGAGGLAGVVGSLQAGVPLNAKSAVQIVVQTMKGIGNVLEKAKATRKLEISQLKVEVEGQNDRPVTLTAKLFVDATWACDESDKYNKAWIETEAIFIGTIMDARSSPNQWNPDDWDPTTGAPRGHMGRSFMEPHGQSDVTGVFKTQPGAHPRRSLMEATAGPIGDETTIDTDVSVSVIADDTVIVAVERVILELSVSTPDATSPDTSKLGLQKKEMPKTGKEGEEEAQEKEKALDKKIEAAASKAAEAAVEKVLRKRKSGSVDKERG